LDGYIKEMTVINVFMVCKNRYGVTELITPTNDGCIFNGSVRKSILEMAAEIEKEIGVKVVEKDISIHEMISAHHEGRLLEFFGGATSCNIQPISRVVYEDENIELSGTKVSSYLNTKLTSIMSGPADHKWITSF
jgi:branched-chain amino acid aminotransferase